MSEGWWHSFGDRKKFNLWNISHCTCFNSWIFSCHRAVKKTQGAIRRLERWIPDSSRKYCFVGNDISQSDSSICQDIAPALPPKASRRSSVAGPKRHWAEVYFLVHCGIVGKLYKWSKIQSSFPWDPTYSENKIGILHIIVGGWKIFTWWLEPQHSP